MWPSFFCFLHISNLCLLHISWMGCGDRISKSFSSTYFRGAETNTNMHLDKWREHKVPRSYQSTATEVLPKEHQVQDNPLWCTVSSNLVRTAEGEEKNPLALLLWTEDSQWQRTQASSLPLVAKGGTHTHSRLRGKGGREAEKAACRSPPFRN